MILLFNRSDGYTSSSSIFTSDNLFNSSQLPLRHLAVAFSFFLIKGFCKKMKNILEQFSFKDRCSCNLSISDAMCDNQQTSGLHWLLQATCTLDSLVGSKAMILSILPILIVPILILLEHKHSSDDILLTLHTLHIKNHSSQSLCCLKRHNYHSEPMID